MHTIRALKVAVLVQDVSSAQLHVLQTFGVMATNSAQTNHSNHVDMYNTHTHKFNIWIPLVLNAQSIAKDHLRVVLL